MSILSGIRPASRADDEVFNFGAGMLSGLDAHTLVATLEQALRIARRLVRATEADRGPRKSGALTEERTVQAPCDANASSLCFNGVTQRQIAVLRLVATGRSNREIAAALSVSERTVERHLENLYRKIDAHNRAEATAYAMRHGLV
jgi:DNA-binding NarL/FixJ family response regulator